MSTDYKVADISLADFGRKEIQLAEDEMPGLMASAPSTRSPAAARRPDHRLAAHDHPDRRAHRDPGRPGRRGPLGELQHLLHPGPRRRRHRRRPGRHPDDPGRPGLRLEGRDARGVLVVHRAGAALAGRQGAQHDPRRRRRRHPPGPPGRRVRGRRGRPQPGRRDSEEWLVILDRLRNSLADAPGKWTAGRRRASRASPRRPPPACTASTRCTGTAACCSRPSTSTTRSPSPSSTTSTAAATRSSTASTAAPT